MQPHDHADQPALGLEVLTSRSGGWARLLEKRALRTRGTRLESWMPALSCAASLIIVALTLRGPSIDTDEVRRQLTPQGTPLRLAEHQPVTLEQRAVRGGVHMYSVRSADRRRLP
jgi:hypothetical protein